MKILNETPWNTAHLRAIALRVLQDVVSPEVRKAALIEFASARDIHIHGYAYYVKIWKTGVDGGPYWFTKIRIPSPNGMRAKFLATNPDLVHDPRSIMHPDGFRIDLAATIAHETGHWNTGGVKRNNRSLRGSHVHGLGPEARERFAWAATMPLEPAKKQITPIDVREARRVRDYQTKVREWETKVRRSTTIMNKWQRRLALAESRLQKAAKP